MVLKMVIGLIPVFVFLIMLLSLDSMKLVKTTTLLLSIGWGFVSAGLSFIINTSLLNHLQISFDAYSCYVSPVIEEVLKFSFLLVLIKKSRIGFMIDGAIYGFSIGAAFSFAENLFYLFSYAGNEGNLMVWITRGFGTAVMHCGTTAIFGILCMSALNRKSGFIFTAIAGTFAAIFIHSLFNQFIFSPLISTILILLIIPLSIVLVFHQNEKNIRTWLELEFDSEVAMLSMIKKGRFTETRTGSYLLSLKSHFPKEVVFDMYCFISLYLELSMKAKGYLMLKENDFLMAPDPEIAAKLAELSSLRRNIGPAGYLAISPVFRMSRKDLWKLSLLNR